MASGYRFNLDSSGKAACYHHPSQQAVAHCKECGKGICKDCYDSYGAGMGAGKAMCFDCTEEMVKDHRAEIAWLQRTVKKERTWMIVGAILGLFLGIAMAPEMGSEIIIIAICAGASLGTIVMGFVAGGPILGIIMIVISPIMTVVRFVKRIKQIKQCEEILQDDMSILQEMRDYFAYTKAMENRPDVDLATLASQGSELYNNTYVQSVMSKGEAAAQAELRQGAVQIAANGEIIRSFDRRIAQRAAS
ncbi:MAG: hypothetical protein LBI54_00865 [Lachnospiraceae bacterium]|jgi:hypothetical protein|nr:hypothetical protein [Lachnospiraceae bacterium]